jgi:hypothetical protein
VDLQCGKAGWKLIRAQTTAWNVHYVGIAQATAMATGGGHFLSGAMGLKTCYIQNFDYDIIEIEIGFFRLSIFSVILME